MPGPETADANAVRRFFRLAYHDSVFDCGKMFNRKRNAHDPVRCDKCSYRVCWRMCSGGWRGGGGGGGGVRFGDGGNSRAVSAGSINGMCTGIVEMLACTREMRAAAVVVVVAAEAADDAPVAKMEISAFAAKSSAAETELRCVRGFVGLHCDAIGNMRMPCSYFVVCECLANAE